MAAAAFTCEHKGDEILCDSTGISPMATLENCHVDHLHEEEESSSSDPAAVSAMTPNIRCILSGPNSREIRKLLKLSVQLLKNSHAFHTRVHLDTLLGSVTRPRLLAGAPPRKKRSRVAAAPEFMEEGHEVVRQLLGVRTVFPSSSKGPGLIDKRAPELVRDLLISISNCAKPSSTGTSFFCSMFFYCTVLFYFGFSAHLLKFASRAFPPAYRGGGDPEPHSRVAILFSPPLQFYLCMF